jgi:polyribonucleotide nucleotidyltransferase
LIHISKLSKERVAKVEDVVNIGDTVRVKVLETDRMGKISLSLKDAVEE